MLGATTAAYFRKILVPGNLSMPLTLQKGHESSDSSDQ